MALPKQTISWPLTGGLDTKRSPLVIQPGSFLQVDNAIQERAGEWRRRNGFTQVAADTVPVAAAPFFASALGGVGIGIVSEKGWAQYSGSQTSNRWSIGGIVGSGAVASFAEDVTNVPVVGSDTSTIGFGVAGNMWVIATATAGSVLPTLTIVDAVTKAISTSYLGVATVLRVRCVGTATRVVVFTADGAGNLYATVIDAASGAVASGPSVIKTGLHTTQPYLDAMWYGGSTVTVVVRTSGDLVRFIEFNPVTLALATDTTIAGVSCANCLSLLQDPDQSGIRAIGTSHTTPTTRVVRVNSAGAVQTDDQAEAVASTQIAGVVSNGGADWNVYYRTTAPNLRLNQKTGGVVVGSSPLRGVTTWGATAFFDTQAWREVGESNCHYLVGLHSDNVEDPQDSWVGFWGVFGGGDIPQGPWMSLQAAAALTLNASLYQVVRTGSRTFRMALPIQTFYQNESGTIARRYTIAVVQQRLLSQAEIGIATNGRGAGDFVGANGVRRFTNGGLLSLGTMTPPRISTLAAGAGGALSPSTTYEYRRVIEVYDGTYGLWRSGPSVPASVTLTAGQNRITVTSPSWCVEDANRPMREVLYRTSGNGSVFRRIASNLVANIGTADWVYVDNLADSAIINGEVLYTTGELSTQVTPAASHMIEFGDRLWLVNRDYRTELWPSKNRRPGRQPEFPAEGVVDIDDECGDTTNVANLDDKGVVFKRNAIYFITGDGLTDAGTGEAHRYTQVSQDIGAIPGSPVVAAGDVIYFVSDRGIYSVDRGGEVAFVGDPVDQYLNQPLVQTQETVFDAVFNPAKNWVIFVTTNYLLIHDRTLNYWTRFTGLAGMKRALIVSNRLVLFKSDGTVWREGDHTQTTDQGVAYTGVVRGPWMNAAGEERGLRLYRARVDGARTVGGASIVIPTSIYFDNDESKVENYTSTAIAGGTLAFRGEMKPGQTQNQKCTSFSIAVTLPSSDVTLRIQRLTATVGIRGGKSELLPASGGVVFS